MLRTSRQLYLHGWSHLQHTRSCAAIFTTAGLNLPSTKLQLPHNSTCSCKLHTTATRRTGRDPEPARMKVISIPNPLRWFNNQMEMLVLKKDWDPTFDISSFKFGVKQAVCTSTELISRREWGELRGLLSQKAISKLRTTKWTDDEVNNLVLEPSRIQVTQIDNVSMQIIVDRKYCDIDMTVIGTRDPYNCDKHSLIVLEYFARFHREYTEGVLPDWTITVFKLKKFEAYERKLGTSL